MKQLGPIALGLTREILIRLNACEEIVGKFTDEFQIISKHEIYKIPIFAHIMESSAFD